jgi:hypothetical protein
VAIASGDFQTLTLASVNLPPIAFSGHGTGVENRDLVLSMSDWDSNGDMLKFRNVSLPAQGALYQFTGIGRGNLISSPNTGLLFLALRPPFAQVFPV